MAQNLIVIVENFQLKFKVQIIQNQLDILKIRSAQVKSTVMFAALNTQGETIIKALKSRDHSEYFKYLKLPIKVTKRKKYDIIKVKGGRKYLL